MSKPTGTTTAHAQPETVATPKAVMSPPLAVQDMTMRDRFAAQIIGSAWRVLCHEGGRDANYHEAASDAYKLADAMIAERSKP